MIAADDMEHNQNNIQNEEDEYNEDEDVWNVNDTSFDIEDSLTQLSTNDPSLTALSIENPDSFAWESVGKYFGTNDELKYLYIAYLMSTSYDEYGDNSPLDSEEKQNIELFCESIGSNRSIETFGIAESDLSTGLPNIFSGTLSPFFKYNDNLCNIGFFDCSLGDGNYNSLISALSRRRNKSSLRSLEMYNCGIGHVEAAKLITVLEGYDNLAKLSLHDSGFERRESYVALASILQDPRHSLKELNLSLKNNNGIRTVSILANAVEKNRTLISFGLYGCANIQEVISIALAQNITCGRSTVRSINLTNSSFDLSGFRKFAACLSSPNCSLRKLSLYNCSLDDQMATELGYGLNNNTTLRVLELGRNSSITLAGWQSILVCLRPSSSIEKLKINDCGIVDEVADEIATALAGNSTLKRLYMNSSSVSASTWQRFSACLCNPNLVLEKLDLSGYHNNTNINSDTVVAFANALTLVNNTRLHSLLVINGWGADDFINFGNYTIDDRCRQVLSNLLCNKADIESIYTSNHTLHTLSSCGFAKDATPKDIASYLKLNENDDKVEVARQKILEYHFMNGTSNIEEFVDMECGELPRALAWVGRNDTGFSILYKMCQSMPSLFDTNSKTNVTGAKRKYGR